MTDSTSGKTAIFFTGATGYIGGAILQKLVDDQSFAITALVRNPDKASTLHSFGVKTIVGSLDDGALVEKAALEADIVIHTADADNLGAIKSILKGMKARRDASGSLSILVHTSGTGVLADNAAGEYATETIYTDSDAAQIASIPDTALHRNVDLEIVNADKEGVIRGHIVLPSTIYGLLTGKLVDAGISNAHSIQIPAAIRASIKKGQGAMIGQGKNLWPNVEIHELADMYMLVLDAALKGTAPHGTEGYYFGENDEYKLLDAAKVYTKTLHALGKSKEPEPVPFTKEDIDEHFGGSPYLGSNSRARAVQARALGWKPQRTNEDFFKYVEEEARWIAEHPEAMGSGKL